MKPIVYSVNNEPIPGPIEDWARANGHKMVRAKHTWTEIGPTQIIEREETVDMPAPFFDAMRFGGPNNDQYDEIERYEP